MPEAFAPKTVSWGACDEAGKGAPSVLPGKDSTFSVSAGRFIEKVDDSGNCAAEFLVRDLRECSQPVRL